MFGRRSDNGDTWTAQFSIEDAKKQGIYRNQWEKMPKVMCMWRCVSQLGRFLFSDILKGVYVQGEISDSVPFNAPINVDIATGELVEEIEKKITKEQIFEFEDILSECSENDQKKAKEYLTSQGFSNYEEIPIKAFEILREKIIKKREEHQNSLKTDHARESGKMMEMQSSLFPAEVK